MATKIGIEVPKHSPLHQECTLVIDPQHGGHKFPSDPRFPLPALEKHCATSWVHAAHIALHDMRHHGTFGGPLLISEVETRFACPKWDVDAICAAALLLEVEFAVYMGTGGSQHYAHWGEGVDYKLSDRIELIRKLDCGELGVPLGDFPALQGLARVAADPARTLTNKIRLATDWLIGLECPELLEEAKKAQIEVDDGLSDAVVTDAGHGTVVIQTMTKGLPSRGRGAAGKFGVGFQTVVQFCDDWNFPGGLPGRKFTVTHRGQVGQGAFLANLARMEEGWGGPTPQPTSWIVGSPQDRPSQLTWESVVSALP